MCPAKKGKIEDTQAFILPVKTDETTDVIQDAKTDYEQKSYTSAPVNPYKKYHKIVGYQPYEQIRGVIQSTDPNTKDVTNQVKPNFRLNFPKSGLFGECSDVRFLTFMNSDSSQNQCGFKKQKMTKEFCQSLSI